MKYISIVELVEALMHEKNIYDKKWLDYNTCIQHDFSTLIWQMKHCENESEHISIICMYKNRDCLSIIKAMPKLSWEKLIS